MRDLIGAAIGAVLLLIAFTIFGPIIAEYENRRLEDTAAEKVAQMDVAAQAYITNNYQAMLSAAAGGPSVITPSTLITAGDLDPAFVSAGGVDTNYWGQNHVTIVRLVAANQLQAMTATCGGNATPDGTLVRLALNVPNDGAAILSSNPSQASSGQKTAAIANFANTTCPLVAGHLVAIAFFDNSQIVPPYLDRFNVPGASPANEPNTMHTTQYMGGNNIQGVGDVIEANRVNPDGTTSKLSQVPFFSLTTDGGSVPKMTGCPNNASPNAIATVAGMIPGAGTPISGFWAGVTDGGTSWIAHLNSYTQPSSGGSGATTPTAVGANSLLVVAQSCPL